MATHRRSHGGWTLLYSWLALSVLPMAGSAASATAPIHSAGLAQFTTATPNTGAAAATLQPDGKIVVAGHAGAAFALARYLPNGQLDSGFGADGRVTTTFAQAASGAALALQPDGKIVIAGSAGSDFALARYRPDGSLDPSFGTGGTLTTAFAGKSSAAEALVLQPDGKLVAAGRAGPDFALVRYRPDGSLDPGFSAGGRATTGFGADAGAAALARQADGKLVAVGTVDEDFALASYLLDGSPDLSFGGGGKMITDFGFGEGFVGLALQPDSKIIAAGYGENGTALARYLPNGNPDPSFGTNGHITEDIFLALYDGGAAAALQPDGKIVLAGGVSGSCFCNIPPADFALARFLPGGSLDPSFGNAGRVVTEVTEGNDWARALVLQPDGTILVAGGVESSRIFTLVYTPPTPTAFGLARYTPNGGLDPSFGGGIVQTEFPLLARAMLPLITLDAR